jgi:hypothetical protein
MVRHILIALAALALGAAPARAESGGWFGGNVDIHDRRGDAMVAAGSVTIAGRITGDALIAAGQAAINGDVGGDARVVAGEYRQPGSVAGEVAVASGKADIDGSVGDDLYVAAEDVHLGGDARVSRNARIAGQDVLVKGRIDGDLDVQGETVAIDAQVGGNVTIRARTIILGPDTTIEGALKWKAAEAPDIPPDAIIAHGVSGQVVKRWDQRGGWAWDRPWRAAPSGAVFAGEAAVRLMIAFSALLIGALIVFLLPAGADRAADTARRRWPAVIAWGVGALIVVPPLAILLMVSIIAIPLGLLALLAYPLLLLTGYAAGAAILGAIILRGRGDGRRILGVGAGVGALTLAGFVPFIGPLIGVAATVLGVGAWLAMARPPRAAG